MESLDPSPNRLNGVNNMYEKILLTAREQAEIRFREKGLDKPRKSRVLGDEDAKLLSGSSLVPQRKLKTQEPKEDIMTSTYNKLYANNRTLAEQIQNMTADKTTGLDMTPEEKNMSMKELGETSPSTGEMALDQVSLEKIVRAEAKLRNMNPDIAVAVFNEEGLRSNTYQSQIKRGGKGSLGGREASFGVSQLYIGGGLGNEYESETGRKLISDNTVSGLTTQIQFALDKAVEQGWSPWYGSKAAGVKPRQGLEDAKPIFNWKNMEDN